MERRQKVPRFEFMSLDGACDAEKEILHNMLFNEQESNKSVEFFLKNDFGIAPGAILFDPEEQQLSVQSNTYQVPHTAPVEVSIADLPDPTIINGPSHLLSPQHVMQLEQGGEGDGVEEGMMNGQLLAQVHPSQLRNFYSAQQASPGGHQFIPSNVPISYLPPQMQHQFMQNGNVYMGPIPGYGMPPPGHPQHTAQQFVHGNQNEIHADHHRGEGHQPQTQNSAQGSRYRGNIKGRRQEPRRSDEQNHMMQQHYPQQPFYPHPSYTYYYNQMNQAQNLTGPPIIMPSPNIVGLRFMEQQQNSQYYSHGGNSNAYMMNGPSDMKIVDIVDNIEEREGNKCDMNVPNNIQPHYENKDNDSINLLTLAQQNLSIRETETKSSHPIRHETESNTQVESNEVHELPGNAISKESFEPQTDMSQSHNPVDNSIDGNVEESEIKEEPTLTAIPNETTCTELETSPPQQSNSERIDEETKSDFPFLTPAVLPISNTTSSGDSGKSIGRSWANIASVKGLNGNPSGPSVPPNIDDVKTMDRISPSPAFVNNVGVEKFSSSIDLLADENDEVALQLGEFLSNYTLDHHAISIMPRGLSNQSNFCYINATLQALISCPPFVNLFRSLKDILHKAVSKTTPFIQSVYEFVSEFEPMNRTMNSKRDRRSENFTYGATFEPVSIRKVLSLLEGTTFKVEGRQEDAEEFLTHLLNSLHEEMLKVMNWREKKLTGNNNAKGYNHVEGEVNGEEWTGEQDDHPELWQVMGSRNKGCHRRKTVIRQTPISLMFLGQMSSSVTGTNLPRSANFEPFYTLHLDIQYDKIRTIRDALEGFTTREEVMGITANGVETEAYRHQLLEDLPPILILHLKRFVFDKSLNKIQKLDKKLDYGVDLEIGKEFLSKAQKLTTKQRVYKLFAVVYHDGEEAHKGHYVADCFHPSGGAAWGPCGWIRYDDQNVKVVSENAMLNPPSPRVPYILYYRRSDTLQSHTNPSAINNKNRP